MSLITNITGWIETNGFDENKEYNDKILKELKYGDFFIDMFCSPKDTGPKNPDYVLFGASLNHFVVDCWLEKFEEFIKKLKAFGAFVWMEDNDGEDIYTIGYYLYDGNFIKDVVKLGDNGDYNWLWEEENQKDIRQFPLLFRILTILKSDSLRFSELHIAHNHMKNTHPNAKYSEATITKMEDEKYELTYLSCNICHKKLARKRKQGMCWGSAGE
jgi:hypothetical protein